ncbi:hypothetical protein D3C77_602560 [compost metagenome]
MKAQKALFLVKLDFYQAQQLFVGSLAVKAHMKQSIQTANFGMAGFVFQLAYVAARQSDIVSIKMRNGLAQCF